MATRKTWRCFFCDEVFNSHKAAAEHFGEEGCEADKPACIDPMRRSEKLRMKELRDARAFAAQCQHEAQRAEEEADALAISWIEIRRTFGEDCNSTWLICDRYQSAINRLTDLEKQFSEARG